MYYLLGAIRGTDFRWSFSKLGGLRALTNAPFMALTATAPPNVANEFIAHEQCCYHETAS